LRALRDQHHPSRLAAFPWQKNCSKTHRADAVRTGSASESVEKGVI
jgi:hypothetical protein